MSTDKLEDARDWFDKSLAVRKPLAAADPAVSAGKLEDARGWFDKALAVAKAFAAADPSNTQRQRDLSLSFEKLGDVAVSAGKLEDARGWFDKALVVRKVLAAADPSNTQWQSDLSLSYGKLGDVAMSAGCSRTHAAGSTSPSRFARHLRRRPRQCAVAARSLHDPRQDRAAGARLSRGDEVSR
jgi:tetratricopeptide (TPR) repeat protein